MSTISKKNKRTLSVENILAAAKKLSAEERQLLCLRLFGKEDLQALKKFEATLKKKTRPVKMADEDIVKLTKTIRQKNRTGARKMLH